VLHSAVRVGYAVIPPDLVEPALRLKWAMDRHVPSLTQRVLTVFLAEGGFERHLRRLRRIYYRRQETLAGALRPGLERGARVETADAGLQLLVRLAPGSDEREEARVLARAAEREVATSSLAAFHATRPAPAGLVLGYAAMPEPDLVEAAHRLLDAMRQG
jgi:GntR family transcriptional regulator / MocR family aminotransferase